jgi:iron complex transport system ATP-binding protein
MPNAISVQHLKHAFDGRTVIDDLTFEVPLGAFFIIIGPNGSGKTTLLKLLVGLLPLRTGQIQLLSKKLGDYTTKSLAKKIAYVPQNVPVEFPFTVTQVVLMGRSPHLGVMGFEGEEDMRLAHKAMTFTDVAHLADRRLDQLSGGEQQRVFIARAVCQQPDMLLLDEPTAALDLSHQVRLMDLMEQLRTEQGVTVVMVSHDLNMAAMYADQLLLISEGRIAGNGPPRQVIDYDLLEQVYGCKLVVDRSPLGDYPRVHLVPQRYLKKETGAS